jgi:hypothetical protein
MSVTDPTRAEAGVLLVVPWAYMEYMNVNFSGDALNALIALAAGLVPAVRLDGAAAFQLVPCCELEHYEKSVCGGSESGWLLLE